MLWLQLDRKHLLLAILSETRDFFQGMEGNPYHYVYEEHEGIHGWDYWDEHITDFLKHLEKFLKK